MKIERFIGEVDFNPLIDEFSKIGPVFQIPCGAVDFVNHDTPDFALAEFPEHLRPDRPPTFRGGFPFFEPFANLKVRLVGMPLDRRFLFRKGDAAFTLAGRRYSDVAEIRIQMFD